MIWSKGNIAPICAALLVACLTPGVRASILDEKTNITISESIEIPGAVLPPGQYVIKLVESKGNRHIVQFLSSDEKHVFSTVLAIPNMRIHPTGKTVLSFYEMPAGQPRAVRAWFYPGELIGDEFAYPKQRAGEISTASNQKVPVAPEDQALASKPESTAETTASAAPAAVEPIAAEPAPVELPSTQPAEQAPQPVERASVQPVEPAPAPAPVVAQAETKPDTTAAQPVMPHTASDVPLWGLLGAGSLAMAGILRVARKSAV
jgi:hypothetical protein